MKHYIRSANSNYQIAFEAPVKLTEWCYENDEKLYGDGGSHSEELEKACKDFNEANIAQYQDLDKVYKIEATPTDAGKIRYTYYSTEPYTDADIQYLKDDLTGQLSDGWGEGYEQQPLDSWYDTCTIYYEEEDENGDIDEIEEEVDSLYELFLSPWWSDSDRYRREWKLERVL